MKLLHTQSQKKSEEKDKAKKIDLENYERFYLSHLLRNAEKEENIESYASKISFWYLEEDTKKNFKQELYAPRPTLGVSLSKEFCVAADGENTPLFSLFEKFVNLKIKI